jgi:hypothetical protein
MAYRPQWMNIPNRASLKFLRRSRRMAVSLGRWWVERAAVSLPSGAVGPGHLEGVAETHFGRDVTQVSSGAGPPGGVQSVLT